MRFKIKFKIVFLLIFFIFLFYFSYYAYQALTFHKIDFPRTNISNEVKGAYHMHTIYSDGIRTPEEIAERASKVGLDFIIITDHGNPNRESLAHQGWIKGILVISGSEISVREGHFVALGFKLPSRSFLGKAKYAMRQVKNLGGFSIIAHPYNMKNPWAGWDAKDFIGIEIINGDSLWREGFFSSLPYFLVFPLRPQYSFLKMTDFPEKNLKKWDELNFKKRIYGFYAVDAHLFYKALFKFLNLHVLVKKPLSHDFQQAKGLILNALSNGKFYNAIDGAARADGFRFWAQKGENIIEMGEMKRIKFPINLNIISPFPFRTETRLIHRGNVILTSNKKHVTIKVRKPGAYRVEVYLRESSPLNREIPWIVSNPIFLRKIRFGGKKKNE